MKWQPYPADSKASQPALSVPSGLAQLWCYYTIAVQYSAPRFPTCCWGDLLKLSICEAEKMEGWKRENRNAWVYSVAHYSCRAKILLFKSKCRTWVLSKQMQHRSLCSAGELHFTNVKTDGIKSVFCCLSLLFSEWAVDNQSCLPPKRIIVSWLPGFRSLLYLCLPTTVFTKQWTGFISEGTKQIKSLSCGVT